MSATETPFISYAQNQEDVLLWRVLKDQPVGFYVDVGAAHPEWESVTKAFYDRGWRGVNFEPNPRFFSMLEKERPRDINICALVGSESGEMELNIVGTSGLSTASSEDLKNLRLHNHHITSKIVSKVVRLDDVLSEQGANEIQFLKIDAEGMEKEVLNGCSFVEFRPKILVIEVTIPETNILRNNGIREYLAPLGYTHVFFDGLNDYFVAKECDKLASEFNRPVNILDNYRPAREIYLEQKRCLCEQTNGEPRGGGFFSLESKNYGVLMASGKRVFNSITTWVNSAKASGLRADDVEWAYQHFFGRSPENQDVVRGHINGCENLKQLVEIITNSREYDYKKYSHFPELQEKPDLRYFFHIHKTGGMSVHEYLRDATPQGELLPGFYEQDILNIGSPHTFRYYSGHFGRLPLMIKTRKVRIATLLRDPVQRGLSHYKHALRTKETEFYKNENGIFNRELYNDLLNNSLIGFLNTPSAALVFGNHQASQLAELTASSSLLIKKTIEKMIPDEELYRVAKEGLSMMEVVGTTEKLHDFIVRLSDKWEIPKPSKKYLENSDPGGKAVQLSQDEIAKIRELCRVDLMIYEIASKLLVG